MPKEQLTLFAEDFHVRMSPLPEKGRALLESGLAYGTSLLELLTRLSQAGLSLKMSPVFYPAGPQLRKRRTLWKYVTSTRKVKLKNGQEVWRVSGEWKRVAISKKSSLSFSNAGMGWLGGFLTLSISEYPNEGAASSLWQVLEAVVAQKYYLSANACRGILRRAERRGKALPAFLEQALRSVAKDQK